MASHFTRMLYSHLPLASERLAHYEITSLVSRVSVFSEFEFSFLSVMLRLIRDRSWSLHGGRISSNLLLARIIFGPSSRICSSIGIFLG